MYTVFKQIQNGEFVHVACRDAHDQAVQLVESLNSHWPGHYVVRDSQGDTVDFAESSVMSPNSATSNHARSAFPNARDLLEGVP